MLISDAYRKLNADLHRRAVFGQRGGRHAAVVLEMLDEFGPGRVVDYGCGRGDLEKVLAGRVKVTSYDPAVERYSRLPDPCEYVVCTDVLEHIEPECLAAVLEHLAQLTKVAAHIVIATKPDGSKKLRDGRDPHLIVRPVEWWRTKLDRYFGAVGGRVRLLNVSNRDCTFRALIS